ncbi:hypothetical protein NE237_011324 [Protea cynaroides]|uniref:Uncharacterized protein n=1 Tax=Protea cynaroides TaxID=273540 RepID=A0A9Q0JWN1_9MAGN|nr:hypothetical protein NE237_011324 [Protea cynaroides]
MAQFAVSSTAKYIGGLLLQEAEFLSGVADQIDNIHVEMRQMLCFLKDADARGDESESFRNLAADIRDLAYDAEDIIETYILKAKYASIINPKKYIRLHQIGKEIKTLQSKILDITRHVVTYGFIGIGQGEETSSTTERQRQLRQPYPHYDEEDVVGIHDNINILVAKLISKESRYLVSIAGMGGLGKITIAKNVYNQDDVKRHFDCCAWSFISQQFQVRIVLQGIRKVCYPNEEVRLDKLNEKELIEKLSRLLEDKCYLVVLDDIWSKEAWDVLKSTFPKGKMGSKIMFTTRNKEVAFYADPSGFLHEPAYLTKEQSWELFCKKAFLWKNIDSTSSLLYPREADEEKKKLGRGMTKKCSGLPLAIVVLGGLLATKQSIHEWERVAKDIGRHLNKSGQKQKEHGLYPEDNEVHKRQLNQMWTAEGFVQHNEEGTTKEEMGEEYLVELINRLDCLQCLSLHYFLLPNISDDYDWSPFSCCHSLLKLQLTVRRLKKLPKLEEFPPNLRKLVLVIYQFKEDPFPTLEMLPYLESLTLGPCLYGYEGYAITKYYISALGFGRLQYLRELESLEELELEEEALPSVVHLQINGCIKLRILPEELRFITSLKKLKVIDMPEKFNERFREEGDIPSIKVR